MYKKLFCGKKEEDNIISPLQSEGHTCASAAETERVLSSLQKSLYHVKVQHSQTTYRIVSYM